MFDKELQKFSRHNKDGSSDEEVHGTTETGNREGSFSGLKYFHVDFISRAKTGFNIAHLDEGRALPRDAFLFPLHLFDST